MSKPVIVQHCFGALGNGGPATELHQILQSDLAKSYDFGTCFQDRPAGGINLPLVFQMARRIRSFRPDLLHVRGLGNEGFHGLLAGRLAGCRRILVGVHGFSGDTIYPTSRVRQKLVSGILEPFTLRSADGVYCVCEYAAKRIEITQNARNFLGHVHNAVPVPANISVNKKLRHSFGFNDRDVVAIFVGRMTKEKGVYDLCEALRILDQGSNQNLKVILIGDGPDFEAVQKITSTLSKIRVFLLGKRYDVQYLLTMSDLFVFPSLHENLSIALLEAMSNALPVVATHVGGNPEVVVDGETGILIPHRDPSTLAKAMSLLAINLELRKQMGMAGRRRVEQYFSIPIQVQNLDRIYKMMLNL